MPLPDRDQRERELQAALLAALLALRTSIELGAPNYPQFVSDATNALTGSLATTYIDAANVLTGQHNTPSDGQAMGVQAEQFAASVAVLVAQGMADRTAAEVANIVARGGSLAGSAVFSAGRAAQVAITETTRAITQGEAGAARLIASRLGSRMVRRWRTERDADVCPICKPLDGKEEFGADGFAATIPEGPPAHPSCRCEVEYRFESPLVGAGV
jgi:hypothetical protein